MALEEIVKVKLHFVEESSYRIIPDLYDYSTEGWTSKKPVCFSTRDLAEDYRILLGNRLCAEGEVKYGGGEYTEKSHEVQYDEYCPKHNDCYITRIAVSSKNVHKDTVLTMSNKQYYYDKKEDKMYEIHDNLPEKMRKVRT